MNLIGQFYLASSQGHIHGPPSFHAKCSRPCASPNRPIKIKMAAAFHAARCASKAVRGRGVLLCCKKTLSLVGELTLESPKCGLVNGLRAFSIGSNLKHGKIKHSHRLRQAGA